MQTHEACLPRPVPNLVMSDPPRVGKVTRRAQSSTKPQGGGLSEYRFLPPRVDQSAPSVLRGRPRKSCPSHRDSEACVRCRRPTVRISVSRSGVAIRGSIWTYTPTTGSYRISASASAGVAARSATPPGNATAGGKRLGDRCLRCPDRTGEAGDGHARKNWLMSRRYRCRRPSLQEKGARRAGSSRALLATGRGQAARPAEDRVVHDQRA